MSQSVTLNHGDKTYEFPLVQGSENELGIDIKSLRAQTGLITYDQGLRIRVPAKWNYFLRRRKGILRYRGYSIEELADNASFRSGLFVDLWRNAHSTTNQKFDADIRAESLVDQDIKTILKLP